LVPHSVLTHSSACLPPPLLPHSSTVPQLHTVLASSPHLHPTTGWIPTTTGFWVTLLGYRLRQRSTLGCHTVSYVGWSYPRFTTAHVPTLVVGCVTLSHWWVVFDPVVTVDTVVVGWFGCLGVIVLGDLVVLHCLLFSIVV